MRIIKPGALHRGDIIGICSPASAPASDHDVSRGIAYLERLGYRVELGKHVRLKRGYLAGTDAQRASDLNVLFANRKVKAIFTARGGYGSHRILPLLNYPVIRRNPKILVGYSDITALQLALMAKVGLVTYSGPMVAAEMAAGLGGSAEEWFWRCVTSKQALPSIQAKLLQRGRMKLEGRRTQRLHRSRGKQYAQTTGRLTGGNLSVVVTSVGTPYFPRVSSPILLLEEIDERPYRVDRMLQQMLLAGVLSRAGGVVLGSFTDCKPGKGKPSLTLRQVFLDTFAGFNYPVLEGVRYGHVKNSLTMPLGIRVRLNPGRGEISFLESAVS